MTDPVEGEVWRYPYLWGWQDDRGETEGRKDRPTAIIAAVHDAQGQKHLFLLPLTTKPPHSRQNAVEVPVIEARRAGLTDSERIWVVLDEYNYDLLQESVYFDPDGKIGRFSRTFSKKLLAVYGVILAKQKSRRINRRDI
ncbi:hypothetical protein [Tabrizicola sp.]|uniref:hypothetical protein n=1 Tax=Tabrizicola sp. TaxID=2005166 RepID=UPI0035B4D52F